MGGFNLPMFSQPTTNQWSCQKPNKELVAVWSEEVSDIIIMNNPYVEEDIYANDAGFFNPDSSGINAMLGSRWSRKWYMEDGGGSLPYKIMGIAKDAGGLPKAGCRALLYRTSGEVKIAETITDDLGIYAFEVGDTVTQYYVIAIQPSPSLAGISVRTLTGA